MRVLESADELDLKLRNLVKTLSSDLGSKGWWCFEAESGLSRCAEWKFQSKSGISVQDLLHVSAAAVHAKPAASGSPSLTTQRKVRMFALQTQKHSFSVCRTPHFTVDYRPSQSITKWTRDCHCPDVAKWMRGKKYFTYFYLRLS